MNNGIIAVAWCVCACTLYGTIFTPQHCSIPPASWCHTDVSDRYEYIASLFLRLRQREIGISNVFFLDGSSCVRTAPATTQVSDCSNQLVKR